MFSQDPELQPYAQLHGAKGMTHPTEGPCFVCEGRFLVEEALASHRKGDLQVLSLLGTAASLERLTPPEGVRALEATREALSALVGFPFHRGLLCAAKVPAEPSLDRLMGARRLVVLPQVDNVDNLGLVLRSAAALGMDGVLVGRGPGVFDRRTVRVSMGAAWKLPVWQREDPGPLLDQWRETGGDVVGAALTPEAMDARGWNPSLRTALLLGPEAYGLEDAWLLRCDRTVAIPMARGMDSLNLAAAAAILMWHMGP